MSAISVPSQIVHRRRRPRLLLYLLMSILAVFFLLPVYLLLITAVKSFDQVSLSRMWDLPTSFSLESFSRAWNGNPREGVTGLSGSFLNSIYMVIPATVISCILGSLNGYVLSKWRFRGSETLFTLILFGSVHPVSEHSGAAGSNTQRDEAVWYNRRPGVCPRGLRHPDYHTDLSATTMSVCRPNWSRPARSMEPTFLACTGLLCCRSRHPGS